MMKVIHMMVVVAGLFLLGVFLAPCNSWAQNKAGVEVNPAFAQVVLEKSDDQHALAISYTNHTTTKINLEFSAFDYIQQDITAKIQFLSPHNQQSSYSLVPYMQFDIQNMELLPEETKTLHVTIKNDINMSPGGHYAAVLAKIPAEIGAKNSVSPAISTLIILRKVGGEKFNFTLESVSWPFEDVVFQYPKNITLLFRNQGNTHIFPYGKIEVKDAFGRLLYKGIINTSSQYIFPDSSRKIYTDLYPVSSSFPVSFNTVVIDSHDSLYKVQYFKKINVIYLNPSAILIPVVLILIGIYLVFRKKK